MKKISAILLTLLLAICCCMSIADETWTCTSCGNESATGKFCSECGAKKPDDKWICLNCGHEATGKFCSECGTARETATTRTQPTEDYTETEPSETALTEVITETEFTGMPLAVTYPVTLDIHFKHNLVMATYDVDLFLDNQFIYTLKHGTDYHATLDVPVGSHTLTFNEHGSDYVTGGTSFDVHDTTSVECSIEAKTLYVEVEKVKINGAQNGSPVVRSLVEETSLTLEIDCEKNAMFSEYDVDVYVDRNYIATIPHGKSIRQTVILQPSNYRLTFFSAEDSSVSNSVNVSVNGATTFQCEIHCKRNKIVVDHIKTIH